MHFCIIMHKKSLWETDWIRCFLMFFITQIWTKLKTDRRDISDVTKLYTTRDDCFSECNGHTPLNNQRTLSPQNSVKSYQALSPKNSIKSEKGMSRQNSLSSHGCSRQNSFSLSRQNSLSLSRQNSLNSQSQNSVGSGGTGKQNNLMGSTEVNASSTDEKKVDAMAIAAGTEEEDNKVSYLIE